MTPLFPNSSSAQTFLGSFDGHDLYFDPQITIPTVIARFGPEGPDYKSGIPLAAVDGHLAEAKRRAIQRGLISLKPTAP